MKSKKKLSLKKIDVAQLNTISGGIHNWPRLTIHQLPTANPDGCGNNTQGMACQYSAAPTSCIYCV